MLFVISASDPKVFTLARNSELVDYQNVFDGMKIGQVHIKVDTGMSRNGCQPDELPGLIKVFSHAIVPYQQQIHIHDIPCTASYSRLARGSIWG